MRNITRFSKQVPESLGRKEGEKRHDNNKVYCSITVEEKQRKERRHTSHILEDDPLQQYLYNVVTFFFFLNLLFTRHNHCYKYPSHGVERITNVPAFLRQAQFMLVILT